MGRWLYLVLLLSVFAGVMKSRLCAIPLLFGSAPAKKRRKSNLSVKWRIEHRIRITRLHRNSSISTMQPLLTWYIQSNVLATPSTIRIHLEPSGRCSSYRKGWSCHGIQLTVLAWCLSSRGSHLIDNAIDGRKQLSPANVQRLHRLQDVCTLHCRGLSLLRKRNRLVSIGLHGAGQVGGRQMAENTKYNVFRKKLQCNQCSIISWSDGLWNQLMLFGVHCLGSRDDNPFSHWELRKWRKREKIGQTCQMSGYQPRLFVYSCRLFISVATSSAFLP